MFSSVITKNVNWKVLTKNIVTFKSWDAIKDERFYYYEGSPKNSIFRGRGHEKSIYREELFEKGEAWTVSKFKGEDLAKERGVVFLRRWVDTPMHTMYVKKALKELNC